MIHIQKAVSRSAKDVEKNKNKNKNKTPQNHRTWKNLSYAIRINLQLKNKSVFQQQIIMKEMNYLPLHVCFSSSKAMSFKAVKLATVKA